MYDKAYYDARKVELDAENKQNAMEAFADMQNIVVRFMQKQNNLKLKLEEVDKKEKESLKLQEESKKKNAKETKDGGNKK